MILKNTMLYKVSLIGANSFLAKYFAKHLKESSNSYWVEGYSRSNKNSYLDNHRTFDYPISPIELEDLLTSDIILYFAGAGIQANRKSTDLEILEINTFLPIRILSFLNDQNYKGKFFTFGSYAEIGVSDRSTLFSESQLIYSTSPVHNFYSVSKRLLTNFINNFKSNFSNYHLILPTIYGPGENDKRLIPYLVSCAQNNLVGDLTSGEQIRQYIHAIEVCYTLEKIINESVDSGIYNIYSPDVLSVKDILYLVEEVMETKIEVRWGGIKRSDTTMKYIALDGSRLEEKIGNIISINIKEGIRTYLKKRTYHG